MSGDEGKKKGWKYLSKKERGLHEPDHTATVIVVAAQCEVYRLQLSPEGGGRDGLFEYELT